MPFHCLLLNLNFSSAVLLREVLLVLLNLGLLDLDGLDFGTLEGLLYSLLGKLDRVPDIQRLELTVLIERLYSDLAQHIGRDNKS